MLVKPLQNQLLQHIQTSSAVPVGLAGSTSHNSIGNHNRSHVIEITCFYIIHLLLLNSVCVRVCVHLHVCVCVRACVRAYMCMCVSTSVHKRGYFFYQWNINICTHCCLAQCIFMVNLPFAGVCYISVHHADTSTPVNRNVG